MEQCSGSLAACQEHCSHWCLVIYDVAMTAASARARVRTEMTREVVDAARRQLATEGAAALSLRAVARELGMASSAIYRYFPSRDELLTVLIVEAYDAFGEAVERAEASVPRDDLLGRWRTACRAARRWALAHPHQYALLYGSPVPGYAAPRSTIGPATRVADVFTLLLADGAAAGRLAPSAAPGAQTALAPDALGRLDPAIQLDPTLGDRAVMAWLTVYGAISFELFGHLNNVVVDYARFFDSTVDRLADVLGVQ